MQTKIEPIIVTQKADDPRAISQFLEPIIKTGSFRKLLKSNCSTSFFKFFLSSSPSSLETPSLRTVGAPSTMSLASFKPRPVASRTALITATLFAPKEVNSTLNSDCSSAAAAAPGAAATATAAADTLNFSSKAEISSTSSRTVFLQLRLGFLR